MKTTPFDVADYLKTARDRAAYLEACVQEAPDDVARARGMTRVAKDAGVTRESLYRSLSAAGNSELDTVLRVTKSLGVRLTFKAA